MVTLDVNGTKQRIDADPDTPLLYVLRGELALNGAKFGCGLGQCGACTVIINGVATRSCVTPTSGVRGEITTLEGLAAGGRLHPLQQAWIDEQVPQCGSCQNGWIMYSAHLLATVRNPSDSQIREALRGLKCRCGSQVGILRAVRRAAGLMKEA